MKRDEKERGEKKGERKEGDNEGGKGDKKRRRGVEIREEEKIRRK